MDNLWNLGLAVAGALTLALAGVGVLWVGAWRSRLGASDAPLPPSWVRWEEVGWVLLFLGVGGAAVLMTGGVALAFLPVAAVILVAVLRRYRDGERQSLLRALTVAAERGIPLEAAAHAFAEERDDVPGARARLLAEYLEAGVPLALALQRSHNPVPAAAALAADLGQQTGTLGPALRQVVEELDELDVALRSILEKFFYLAIVGLFAVGVMGFLMIKIIPVFCKVFQDFGMQLPRVTQVIVEGFRECGPAGAIVFVAVLALFLILAIADYVRLSPRWLPIVRRLWWPADCAVVLRWLALAVRQGQPLAGRVRQLAGHFPAAAFRRRLERAAGRIDAGEGWCESLRRVGLIRPVESAVFQAAERAGNLAWALESMAGGNVRRMTYRMRAWLQILFPLLVLLFGICVFVIAVGLLLPVFSLIQGLIG